MTLQKLLHRIQQIPFFQLGIATRLLFSVYALTNQPIDNYFACISINLWKYSACEPL